MKLALAFVALVSLPAPALCGEPSDLVKRFYTDVGLEFSDEGRAVFTAPATEIFALDEKLSKGGEEIGCIDFGLAVDAQDYDDAEIARTLKLSEKSDGDVAVVTASVDIFAGGDAHREIEWDLKRVGGAWKIADIASITGDWRLSAFDCSGE